VASAVRRWTQRRLLYPLAVFAIIAPTVVMGLFGTYALREIELRPSGYREQLHAVRQGVEILVETRLHELAIAPPAGPQDVARASSEVERYFLDYTRAIAAKAYVGTNGRAENGLSVDATRGHVPPPGLQEALAAIRAKGQPGVSRETLALDLQTDGEVRHRTFVIYVDNRGGGFIAWEMQASVMDRVVRQYLQEFDLKNDALSTELVDRSDFEWSPRQQRDKEILGFAPAHDTLLPDRYVVLKVDTNRQFYKDETLLSTIFIVIAVLCVPIVASATLMVVHMILREASEARKKVDFVSNVTHELKTPLTSIRMYVETLQLGRVKDPAMVQKWLDTIMSETQRLGGLIDHVLSFSKVENQVKKYNIQPNDLTQVVVDTINFFRGQAPKLRDRLQKQVRPGVPSTAEFDKDAIREVLLNLLSNAVKYSPGEKPIFVTVGAGDKELFIAVQDQGIGIDSEHHERIFEKFFRVDEDLTRNVDGTGLGLAICSEIVKAHGGRITVESALGRGSTFTVYLPWRHGKPSVTRRKTTRTVSTREPEVAAADTPAPPTAIEKPQPQGANVKLLSTLLVAAMALPLAWGLVSAQEEPEEITPKKEGGTLLPRAEEDPPTVAWVKKLGGLRTQAVTVEPGVLLSHTLTPEGDRLYYYRVIGQPAAPDKNADPRKAEPPPKYALYTVGPEKAEAKVMETGASKDPPLFLPDGRIVLTQRRQDTNDDGEISQQDDATLVVCNRDGEAVRDIARLESGTNPVAVWKKGAEILLAEPGVEDPNGWIVSLNLVKGTRERVVKAFNVSLVLDADKLLLERLVAPPPPPQQPNGWGDADPSEQEPEQRAATLDDPPEHVIYDPADGSVNLLHASTARSRIVCTGEGSYFGHQYSQAPQARPRYYGQNQQRNTSEVLIVDDAQHRDTRNDGARNDHYALGWVKERGLLVLRVANLRSNILLLDRALKWHTLGDLDFSVAGVQASQSGLKLAWLEVEDTDKNGLLEPWKDQSRPVFCTIE